MRNKILKLIQELEKAANENEHIHKHGSPMTSMSEDSALGMLAVEQRRIINKLRKALDK